MAHTVWNPGIMGALHHGRVAMRGPVLTTITFRILFRRSRRVKILHGVTLPVTFRTVLGANGEPGVSMKIVRSVCAFTTAYISHTTKAYGHMWRYTSSAFEMIWTSNTVFFFVTIRFLFGVNVIHGWASGTHTHTYTTHTSRHPLSVRNISHIQPALCPHLLIAFVTLNHIPSGYWTPYHFPKLKGVLIEVEAS